MVINGVYSFISKPNLHFTQVFFFFQLLFIIFILLINNFFFFFFFFFRTYVYFLVKSSEISSSDHWKKQIQNIKPNDKPRSKNDMLKLFKNEAKKIKNKEYFDKDNLVAKQSNLIDKDGK
mgnify:CR=1 FL=1